MQIFSFACFLWLFYQHLLTKVTFLFEFVPLRERPYYPLFTNEQQEKKVADDVKETCATHAGLVDDVTDTDCQTQHGGARGLVPSNCYALTRKVVTGSPSQLLYFDKCGSHITSYKCKAAVWALCASVIYSQPTLMLIKIRQGTWQMLMFVQPSVDCLSAASSTQPDFALVLLNRSTRCSKLRSTINVG